MMVLKIGRFWKRVSWELILDDVGRQLGCLPLRQRVEVRPWWWEVGSDNDVEKLRPTMVLRNWDWTTRCAERWGFVSIVWYERPLRIVSISLSLFVSKNRSQKLINGSYLNNRATCVFVLCGLHIYYGYTIPCHTKIFLFEQTMFYHNFVYEKQIFSAMRLFLFLFSLKGWCLYILWIRQFCPLESMFHFISYAMYLSLPPTRHDLTQGQKPEGRLKWR